jgi:hypothetical protein
MFIRIYRNLFHSHLKEIPFIIFLSFFLTFVIARSYIYITNRDILEFFPFIDYINIRGIHVHHLSWGIIILAVTGFLALSETKPFQHRRVAIFYGIGLGLTFDEFAIWLRLQDDYYARLSYDAVIFISLLFLNIIYFPGFWSRTGKKLYKLATRKIH